MLKKRKASSIEHTSSFGKRNGYHCPSCKKEFLPLQLHIAQTSGDEIFIEETDGYLVIVNNYYPGDEIPSQVCYSAEILCPECGGNIRVRFEGNVTFTVNEQHAVDEIQESEYRVTHPNTSYRFKPQHRNLSDYTYDSERGMCITDKQDIQMEIPQVRKLKLVRDPNKVKIKIEDVVEEMDRRLLEISPTLKELIEDADAEGSDEPISPSATITRSTWNYVKELFLCIHDGHKMQNLPQTPTEIDALQKVVRYLDLTEKFSQVQKREICKEANISRKGVHAPAVAFDSTNNIVSDKKGLSSIAENYISNKLSSEGKVLLKASDKGDCFFESIAIGLNKLGRVDSEGKRWTAKSVRLLERAELYSDNAELSQFVRDCFISKHQNDDIDEEGFQTVSRKEAFQRAAKDEFMKLIDLTAEECSAPIWGEPQRDLRILCASLNIPVRVIAFEKDLGDAAFSDTLYIFNPDTKKLERTDLTAEKSAADVQEKRIEIAGDGRHFVPVMLAAEFNTAEDEKFAEELQLTEYMEEVQEIKVQHSINASTKRIKMFLSYGEAMTKKAAPLARSLIEDGIDCKIDIFKEAEEKKQKRGESTFRAWVVEQCQESDFIGVICDRSYYQQLSNSEAKQTQGLKTNFEGHIIFQQIYNDGGRNKKILPILFDKQDEQYIPDDLKGFTYYVVDGKDGYHNLYRKLRGVDSIKLPEIGPLKPVPKPREIQPLSFRKEDCNNNNYTPFQQKSKRSRRDSIDWKKQRNSERNLYSPETIDILEKNGVLLDFLEHQIPQDSRCYIAPHLLMYLDHQVDVPELVWKHFSRQFEEKAYPHFMSLLKALKDHDSSVPIHEGTALLAHLVYPEIPWVGLGYSEQSIWGVGVGAGVAVSIANNLLKIVHNISETSGRKVFALFPFLTPDPNKPKVGFGADAIGDMTTCLLLKNLLDYTQDIVKQFPQPRNTCHWKLSQVIDLIIEYSPQSADSQNFKEFDLVNKLWHEHCDKTYELPFFDYDGVKFPRIYVPHAIVDPLPEALQDLDIFWLFRTNSTIRARAQSYLNRITPTDNNFNSLRVQHILESLSSEDIEKLLNRIRAPCDFSIMISHSADFDQLMNFTKILNCEIVPGRAWCRFQNGKKTIQIAALELVASRKERRNRSEVESEKTPYEQTVDEYPPVDTQVTPPPHERQIKQIEDVRADLQLTNFHNILVIFGIATPVITPTFTPEILFIPPKVRIKTSGQDIVLNNLWSKAHQHVVDGPFMRFWQLKVDVDSDQEVLMATSQQGSKSLKKAKKGILSEDTNIAKQLRSIVKTLPRGKDKDIVFLFHTAPQNRDPETKFLPRSTAFQRMLAFLLDNCHQFTPTNKAFLIRNCTLM